MQVAPVLWPAGRYDVLTGLVKGHFNQPKNRTFVVSNAASKAKISLNTIIAKNPVGSVSRTIWSPKRSRTTPLRHSRQVRSKTKTINKLKLPTNGQFVFILARSVEQFL